VWQEIITFFAFETHKDGLCLKKQSFDQTVDLCFVISNARLRVIRILEITIICFIQYDSDSDFPLKIIFNSSMKSFTELEGSRSSPLKRKISWLLPSPALEKLDGDIPWKMIY